MYRSKYSVSPVRGIFLYLYFLGTKGMSKCGPKLGPNCTSCPYMREGKRQKSMARNGR